MNTDAGVLHRNGDRFRLLASLEDDRHAAAFGELDGVAGDVERNLAQARGVADDTRGQALIDIGADFQAFGLGARPQKLNSLLDESRQRERSGRKIEAAGLDLGEIENLLDQRQQRFPRGLHRVEICRLLGSERRVAEKIGHAEMPFSGVRISCDTMVRKRDFARLAASA